MLTASAPCCTYSSTRSAKPLLQKPGISQRRVKLVVFKPDPVVEFDGTRIALQYFQRELAGTTLARNFLYQHQHFLSHALPAIPGQHGNVMHIHQGTAGKG